MAWLVTKDGHQNNPCEDEIGLHAYNINAILDFMVVIIEREGEREFP